MSIESDVNCNFPLRGRTGPACETSCLGIACILFLIFSGAVNAGTIGVSVGGTCEAGTCPPTPLAFNSADTLPLNFTLTLPDGDRYLVNGSFTGTNNSNGGAFSTNHAFQVTYEGNATGGASAADTIVVQAEYAMETTVGSVVFNRDLIGAFGPTIAASSSGSSCVNGTLGCLGPVMPPGSFSELTSFSISSSGGVFVFDPAFTNNFGAGSAVGSYIVWGQTTALAPPPPPTPEPASLALFAAGLGGICIARFRRARCSGQNSHTPPRPA